MTNNSKNTYQITIYTPTLNSLYSPKNIHSQYLEEAHLQSHIYLNPTFQQTITTLKQQYPYTHYLITQL